MWNDSFWIYLLKNPSPQRKPSSSSSGVDDQYSNWEFASFDVLTFAQNVIVLLSGCSKFNSRIQLQRLENISTVSYFRFIHKSDCGGVNVCGCWHISHIRLMNMFYSNRNLNKFTFYDCLLPLTLSLAPTMSDICIDFTHLFTSQTFNFPVYLQFVDRLHS